MNHTFGLVEVSFHEVERGFESMLAMQNLRVDADWVSQKVVQFMRPPARAYRYPFSLSRFWEKVRRYSEGRLDTDSLYFANLCDFYGIQSDGGYQRHRRVC